MTLILDGRPHAAVMKEQLAQKTQEVFGSNKVYMAIIFVGENSASAAYVGFKKRFGEDIGIGVEIFGQDSETNFDHLQSRKDTVTSNPDISRVNSVRSIGDSAVIPAPEPGSNMSPMDSGSSPEGQNSYTPRLRSGGQINTISPSKEQIIQLINFLNNDPACVGIIVQLPLPDPLRGDTAKITQHIHPSKDIDAMGGMIYGMDSFGTIDFLGATPQAAMTLLKQYNLDTVRGKTVSIVGQSNLIGKPLATHLMKKGATVLSFNSKSPKEQMYKLCQESEYIFACTGVIHVIDEQYINDKKNQIIVDIGYGYKDGKPVGDVQLDQIKDKVAAYTPIPGGVGPLTVASLFANIFRLYAHFHQQ